MLDTKDVRGLVPQVHCPLRLESAMKMHVIHVLVALALIACWGYTQVPAARRLHVVPMKGQGYVYVNTGSRVIPDFDGDGIKDLCISGSDSNPVTELVQIISGRTGTLIWEVRGERSNQFWGFGSSITALPDLDGDKRPEILIGAEAAYNKKIRDAGAVFLYSSKTKKILWERRGSGEAAFYGGLMRRLDDLDGDGFDDWCTLRQRQGIWDFYSGRSGKYLRSLSYGSYNSLRMPLSIPDLDKDGVRDLVVPAALSNSSQGRLLILSGKTFKLIKTIFGHTNGEEFGKSIALVPDANGDGVEDLVASARYYPNTLYYVNGYVRLISLADGKVLQEWKSPMKALDRFGMFVGHAGDIDRDGVPDVLISLLIANDPIGVKAYSGKRGKLLRTYAAIPGKGTIYGGQCLGDVNGDGVDDVAILSVLNPPQSSSVHVFSGRQQGLDANKTSLSLSKQERLEFKIDAGPTHVRKLYLLLGSLSGEDPGLQIGSHYLPLVWDPYSVLTLGFANSSLLTRSFFPYTGASNSRCYLTMLPGMPTSLIGLSFHHAYLIWDAQTGSVDFTSNAVKTKILK